MKDEELGEPAGKDALNEEDLSEDDLSDENMENDESESDENVEEFELDEEKQGPFENSESASNSGNNSNKRENKPHIKNELKPLIVRREEPRSLESKIVVKETRQQETRQQETLQKFVNIADWLKKIGWNKNPFNFTIDPSLFIGYAEQKNMLLRAIDEGHKLILISGPTGSGKTSLLRWASENLDNRYYTIFLGKPPDVPERFIEILNYEFKPSWFLRPFISNIKNMYEIPGFLNKKLKGRQLVILCDEIHESDMKVLEWLRVLSDHIDNVSVVLSGLPVFETHLNGLETFKKRIIERIELLSLTKEETANLIETRIKSVGGGGNEFSNIVDIIYERTRGFPREVLRYCNDVLDEAVRRNTTTISDEVTTMGVKKEAPKTAVVENLTPMQRRVLELLKVPMTPGGLADMLDLGKYKSRQHAVRSVNNILKLLMENGYVERTKDDKAFLYSLAPRVRTIFVRS